jgi:SAM-dependent methyltransferase
VSLEHSDVVSAAEIERIRVEYARRRREVPSDFYGWGKPANFFLHSQICRTLIPALVDEEMFPLDGHKVLDVGCGQGTWLLEFAQWHACELYGIDLDEYRIEVARHRLPHAEFHCGDARSMPWGDETFDLIAQFTMFTSVLAPEVKRELASEMLRVLKPSGVIVWYDFCFNNPHNPNVRGIKYEEIVDLFVGCRAKGRSITLAPPLARRIVPLSWSLALLLEKCPFLCTHWLGLIKKNH